MKGTRGNVPVCFHYFADITVRLFFLHMKNYGSPLEAPQHVRVLNRV
jgi:hypothetical protein